MSRVCDTSLCIHFLDNGSFYPTKLFGKLLYCLKRGSGGGGRGECVCAIASAYKVNESTIYPIRKDKKNIQAALPSRKDITACQCFFGEDGETYASQLEVAIARQY